MANTKYSRYNHDYTHCTGNDCINKKDCVRYLSFLEALELKLENFKIQGHCENEELEYVKVKIEELSS